MLLINQYAMTAQAQDKNSPQPYSLNIPRKQPAPQPFSPHDPSQDTIPGAWWPHRNSAQRRTAQKPGTESIDVSPDVMSKYTDYSSRPIISSCCLGRDADLHHVAYVADETSLEGICGNPFPGRGEFDL